MGLQTKKKNTDKNFSVIINSPKIKKTQNKKVTEKVHSLALNRQLMLLKQEFYQYSIGYVAHNTTKLYHYPAESA